MANKFDTPKETTKPAPEVDIEPTTGLPTPPPIDDSEDEISSVEDSGLSDLQPEAEPTPTPLDDEFRDLDDATSAYEQHRKNFENQARIETLDRELGTAEEPNAELGTADKLDKELGMTDEGIKPEPGPIPTPMTPAEMEHAQKSSAVLDVATGAVEAISLRAPISGTREFLQSLTNLADETGDWLRERMPDFLAGGLVSDEDGLRVLGKEKYEAWKKEKGVTRDLPNMPEVRKPTSKTGELVAGITQFLVPFAIAGNILPVAQGAGKALKLARNAVQSGIADFTAFDGHQERFSNLLKDMTKDYPELSNIVGALAADPNDSQLVGRFKNVMEGMGLSAVADGFLHGIKYIFQGKQAKQAVENAVGAIHGENVPVRSAESSAFSALGDSKAELIYTRNEEKILEGAAATQGMGPKSISGKSKKGPEVFINFARIDTQDDIKTVIKKMANANKKGIDEARRGTRSWEQTKLSAEQKDAWDLLMSRRKGETFNAEEGLAARQLWTASAEKLKEVAKIAKGAPTEENLVQFRKMLSVHYAIQKEVIAARTETARALNAWKIPAGSGENLTKQLQTLLEQSGGSDVSRQLAEKIALLSDPSLAKGMEKLVQGSAFARTRAAVTQVWINALLTNPTTHVANGLSNLTVVAQAIWERKIAEHLSQRLGTEGGVAAGEAVAMLNGAVAAFKDSLSAVTKKLRSTENAGDAAKKAWEWLKGESDVAVKAEKVPQGALSSETWNQASDSALGQALDVVNVTTQTPSRLLGASDEFFKGISYRMELHSQAVRKATEEFKGMRVDPAAFKKRVAEIIENPPENIYYDAVDAAAYQTFTNKPAELLKGIGDKIQKVPVLGRLLLPFKNTPINIMTYTFERTPLAPLVKRWRQDVLAGGARADIALSRMASGTYMMAAFMDLAMAGQVTGQGPTDPGHRAQWIREGNRPYSVKIGDKWVSYARLDPMGLTAGIAADIAEAMLKAGPEIGEKEFSRVVVAAAFSLTNNMLSKTYMQGMAEFMNAVTASDMKSWAYAQRLSASLIPSGMGSITRMNDPYLRTARNLTDALRRKIPGLSKDLPLYRDLWGREVSYRSPMGALYDALSPAYVTQINPEPIDTELGKLEYYPDMPNRKIHFGQGVAVELDGHQYSRYVQLAGNELKHPVWQLGLKDFLNALVTGDHMKSQGMSELYRMKSDGPDGGKMQMIKKYIDDYREKAKAQLLEEDKKLAAEVSIKRARKPSTWAPEIIGR